MMEIIRKTRGPGGPQPNLADYAATCGTFTWQQARLDLAGLPGGALNIAHEAVDRHARGPRSTRVAMRWVDRDGGTTDFTYTELRELTARFANVLRSLGVGRGDRVFVLLDRVPELYVAALGTLKNGSVFCPLFSAFGPEPIAARLTLGNGRVLVTTRALYERRVAEQRGALPELQHVLLVGDDTPAREPGVHELRRLLEEASAEFDTVATAPHDMALLHFTSGTTGRPKGAVHVHEAVLAHRVSGQFALDLRPDDIFWCTADPGWVTGTSYGIIAPLALGATLLVDRGEFDAEHWLDVLATQQVNVWYTAPTALRMMMRFAARAGQRDLSALRLIASVGEPLNPEVVVWAQESLGRPVHDNWWQTETGAIMIANYAAMDIKPGSMGRPLPGVQAAIVERIGPDRVRVIDEPGETGELALRRGWPSMFRGYLGDEERYHRCFAGEWYLSGDLARRDADGYFWFVGRADDVIKSAGHLIGPFEVENALLEHPAVAEVGVIGKPDPVTLEQVKAYVSLKPGYSPDEALRRALLVHARKRLGTAVAPKEIEFRERLPRTRSGKIMRRLLKAQELGLPSGDLSTLEDPQ